MIKTPHPNAYALISFGPFNEQVCNINFTVGHIFNEVQK
jgi:hypothetical protein